MVWLLIDNSNSRTKFQLGDREGLIGEKVYFPTAELRDSELMEISESFEFCGVVLASVVPEKAELIRNHFSGFPFHQISHDSPLGFEFDLAEPEQVGQDRLANSIALKEHYGAPGIAIDFGTAVTFSLISETGKFVGGVIAPGMDCMTDHLNLKTARLPKVQPSAQQSAIGKTTEEAIRSGAIIGHRGMVREILSQLVAEMGADPVVVATGGGAEFAARQLPEISRVDPDLTMEGLRLLAGRVIWNTL